MQLRTFYDSRWKNEDGNWIRQYNVVPTLDTNNSRLTTEGKPRLNEIARVFPEIKRKVKKVMGDNLQDVYLSDQWVEPHIFIVVRDDTDSKLIANLRGWIALCDV